MPKLNKTKIIVAVCYFMQSMLIILANRYTSAGCATALQNTSPIYIICLSALYLKHKPLKREIVTCACMLLGICLTLVGSIGGGFWGNILALISAFFYAGVFFFSNRPDANPFESLVLGNGLFVLLLPVLLADPHVQAGQPSNWLIVLACSLLSGTVAWLFFAYSIRYVSALQANFITMTEPIMSPLWTYLFLREKMSATAVAGCVIVIVTLLIYNRLNRPHPVRVPKKDEAVSLTKLGVPKITAAGSIHESSVGVSSRSDIDCHYVGGGAPPSLFAKSYHKHQTGRLGEHLVFPTIA